MFFIRVGGDQVVPSGLASIYISRKETVFFHILYAVYRTYIHIYIYIYT